MYLYDNNPLNDVLYLTNMNGLLETLDVLQYTADGGTTTSMDDYQNYTLNNTFSREKVVAIYNDYVPVVKTCEFDVVSLEKTVVENLEQNLIPTIEKNPQVEFLCYFPPYSIARWGLLENPSEDIECMRIIVERIIDYPNVSIYFFQGEQETITDLSHYMDTIHFDSVVANQIIDFMADEKNKMTVENYNVILNEFSSFVRNYDYTILQK